MAQTETILVVDDDRLNLELTATVLAHAGFRVLQAMDAQDALEVIQREPPQLILMDLVLPGMDGLTFARLLKGNPETRDIKIVALTAQAMPGSEEQALKAGCDGYISKPYDIEILPKKVAAYLRCR